LYNYIKYKVLSIYIFVYKVAISVGLSNYIEEPLDCLKL